MKALEWIDTRFAEERELRGGAGTSVVRDVLSASPRSLCVRKSATEPSRCGVLERELKVLLDTHDHWAFRSVRAVGRGGGGRIDAVLEHIEGTPLGEIPHLTADELYAIAVGLLRALAYLHGRGLVHGDLKPDNVIISRGPSIEAEDVRLIDLELATELGQPILGGTPGFLAPELLRGGVAAVSSDLYAFGAMLRPYLMKEDHRVGGLVEACLEDDPDLRPASASAALAMVGRSLTPEDRVGTIRRLGSLEVDSLVSGAIETFDGRTVVVVGAKGQGRSRLFHDLREPLLRAGKPIVDVTVERGATPFVTLAGLVLDLVPSDATRASTLGAIEAASVGLPIILDDVDEADDLLRSRLIVISTALSQLGRGALILIGADEQLARELTEAGASQTRLAPLDVTEVEQLFGLFGIPPDPELIEVVHDLTHGASGQVVRAVRFVAQRGGATPDAIEASLASRSEKSQRPSPPMSREEVLRNASRALDAHSPTQAIRLIEELDKGDRDREVTSIFARGLAMSGRLEDALLSVESCKDDFPVALQVEAALWLNRLGRHVEALEWASPHVNAHELARVIMVQATLELGDYERAGVLVEQHFYETSDPGMRTMLLCALSDAAQFQGRLDEAIDAARRAQEEASLAGDVSLEAGALAREAAAQAMSGNNSSALELCQSAYDAARRAGDLPGLPPYILNLANVEQSLGEYGEALRHYEEAAELARRLGRSSARAAALINQAGLLVALGVLSEASQALDVAQRAAQETGVAFYDAQGTLLRAEILGGQHDISSALDVARRALKDFRKLGAARQAIEAELLLAELAAQGEDFHPAHRLAASSAKELDDAGLTGRLEILLATCKKRESPEAALRHIDTAINQASKSGDLLLEAKALQMGASIHGRLGTHAEQPLELRARELTGRLASRLPSGLRERFLAHHEFATENRDRTQRSIDGLEPETRRLVDLMGRLLSEQREATLLEATVDEAVQLTGAERAFLLVRSAQGEPRVSVARNVDQDAIRRPRTRFSHSVAKQVLESGDLVVTAHATEDPTLEGSRSIVDLGLRSILCVPIRSPRGVVAALYLDNRFEVGRFGGREVELIQALVNIIGVTLENARLHREASRRLEELERVRAQLEEHTAMQAVEVERLHRALETQSAVDIETTGGMVGSSRGLRRALALARRVATTSLSILIEGESGTGKELMARYLHEKSARRSSKMLAFNCGAVTDSLLESELFGHVRGAFTGALHHHIGIFRAASKGTVFLDEVGEMSTSMQAKLLRVLENGEVKPVGAEDSVQVDVRVIAATNRDLEQEVATGRFREDLYYRLAGVRVWIPPLRERTEDIEVLAHHFVQQMASESGLEVKRLTASAVRAMLRHRWPGNIRELQHAIRRAVATAEGDQIRPSELGLGPPSITSPRGPESRFRRDLVEKALAQARGNRTRAAELLGVSRTTLYRWLARYDV